MDYQSIVTFVMEMAGSVAFAASGAMVGVERNMDIFGVSVLGVATAVGGGMIRDNGFTQDVYVAPYKGDRVCAISYTFDRNRGRYMY